VTAENRHGGDRAIAIMDQLSKKETSDGLH